MKYLKLYEHKLHKTTQDMLDYIEHLSIKTLVFIDTETTGLLRHKIEQLTQISAIAFEYDFENNQLDEIDTFNNKIKLTPYTLNRRNTPEGKKQLDWVLRFNHYGNKIANNPKYLNEKEVLNIFLDWLDKIDNPVLILQNASFDMDMICGRSGEKIKYEILDTKQLLQYFVIPITQKLAEDFPEYGKSLKEIGISERDKGLINSSMSKWGTFFGIDMKGYHDGLTDCRITSQMFLEIINYMEENKNLDISIYQNKRIKLVRIDGN